MAQPTPMKRKWSLIPKNRQEWQHEGREWLKSIIVVLAVFLPVITFVVQGFRIPSSSMEDSLLIGDFLFADKITYGARVPLTHDSRVPGLRPPKPGDIVIFKSPQTGENLIKRCMAVAGQTLEMRRKVVYINGQPLNEPYTKHIRNNYMPQVDDFGPYTVPAGTIFCLGDNRDYSHDCRFFGPIPMRNVVAKADILYFSFNPKKMLPRIWRIGKLL
jgi:signal peptidase I